MIHFKFVMVSNHKSDWDCYHSVIMGIALLCFPPCLPTCLPYAGNGKQLREKDKLLETKLQKLHYPLSVLIRMELSALPSPISLKKVLFKTKFSLFISLICEKTPFLFARCLCLWHAEDFLKIFHSSFYAGLQKSIILVSKLLHGIGISLM